MSTPEENRAEMRRDNLETAYGTDPLDDCPRCGRRMTDYIAGTGVCRRCHENGEGRC